MKLLKELNVSIKINEMKIKPLNINKQRTELKKLHKLHNRSE